jgi:hypothetical protein
MHGISRAACVAIETIVVQTIVAAVIIAIGQRNFMVMQG